MQKSHLHPASIQNCKCIWVSQGTTIVGQKTEEITTAAAAIDNNKQEHTLCTQHGASFILFSRNPSQDWKAQKQNDCMKWDIVTKEKPKNLLSYCSQSILNSQILEVLQCIYYYLPSSLQSDNSPICELL